ncbi:MAG TPA: biotin--[acetyl-CoA-carboxylase] ligase [Streptosporangiaceae bacterium]
MSSDWHGWEAALEVARLREVVAAGEPLWTDLRVVGETASTNEDVLKLAADGAPEGLVLAAEWQTAGRGRQGRVWQSGPTGALTFSVLLRPATVPPPARGWVPLLTGVAVAAAVRRVAGLDARLKWPNDVLAGEKKLAGILAEQCGDSIVVGTGLNILGRPGELPAPTATSLQDCGAGPGDRTSLLAEILRQVAGRYRRWQAAGGDAGACGLLAEYAALCATIGKPVRVLLPAGRVLEGTATGVDGAGQLLVRLAGQPGGSGRAPGDVAVSAGDVIHVR